ncbi:hypothetical protein GCM10026986_05240 [Nitrincola alkalisediminis]
MIQRDNLSIQAQTGSPLETKDIFVTAQNARAQIVLNDGTVISVGGNTELQIDEFTEVGTPKVSMNVAQGTFKAITGRIARQNPESFRLGTRTATVGIRGTIISGKVTPDFELFATLRGQIFVVESITGASVDVPSGQYTRVLAGFTPTPASDLIPAIGEELNTDPTTPPPSANLLTDTQTLPETTSLASQIPATDSTLLTTTSLESLNIFSEIQSPLSFEEPASVSDVLDTQVSQDNFDDTLATAPTEPTTPPINPPPVNVNPLSWWYSAINADFLAMPFTPPVGDLPDAADNYSKWGLWDGGAWVAGVERLSAVNHLNSLTNQIYTFEGKAKGHVYYGFVDVPPHAILENTLNKTELTFNFGTNEHTGFMRFETSNGFVWAVSLEDGNVTKNIAHFNFLLKEIEQDIQGTLLGSFFGPEAQSLGGFFNMTDTVNEIQALGVIRAEK